MLYTALLLRERTHKLNRAFALSYSNIYLSLRIISTGRDILLRYRITNFGELLFFIACTFKKENSSHLPWLWLAAIFVFLSLDEMLSIREHLIEPVRDIFETSGLLFYAWVIPYGIALVLFIMAYSTFLLELPKNIMVLFLVSGTIFVSGAIGFELLGGNKKSLPGDNSLLYSVFYTCEEFLEMLGIAVFIYTLLSYIGEHFEHITVTIKKPKM